MSAQQQEKEDIIGEIAALNAAVSPNIWSVEPKQRAR